MPAYTSEWVMCRRVVVIVYSSIMIRIRQDLPSSDGSLAPIKHIAAQAGTGNSDGY
jgi:hypothetical protein